MSAIEVRVPDIGDFEEVEVIEVMVSSGDEVQAEQSLVTVESDKASMEIPSSASGRVVELRVKVGDKVSEGSVLLVLEEGAGGSAGSKEAPAPAPAPKAAKEEPARAPAPSPAARPTGSVGSRKPDSSCALVVIGGGPGGYAAAFRAADLGLEVVLVERYPTLGGVCLNVGCIPSKALLHTAAVIDEARALASHGVDFGEPRIDLDRLRGWKSEVVGKLTGGLAGMAKGRKVEVIRGTARFADPHHLEIELTDGPGRAATGETRLLRFDQAIVAAGSQAVRLPFLPDDPRVVDSTGALALESIPGRMLVIGGGIIGLEMGTVYATLGAKVEVVEMLDGLMAGADADLVRVWQKHNAGRFARVMLGTRTTGARATPGGIEVSFEGKNAPDAPEVYDLVLCSVGRRPNGAAIGAEAAGIMLDDRGFIRVDAQMRTSVPHVFAIGDIVGDPMLAHKAAHEGHVAAEAAAGQKSRFDARVIPSVAYTDPEVAWVGVTEAQAKAESIPIGRAVFPWAASGRATANGRAEGFTKLIFDEATHRVIGGAIVGVHAGDMIGEVALAIEMGADATDIGATIHPHPTLGETIGLAAELFEGACTELPPARKR
jgi:dihydrolipoamide dehydrogenase